MQSLKRKEKKRGLNVIWTFKVEWILTYAALKENQRALNVKQIDENAKRYVCSFHFISSVTKKRQTTMEREWREEKKKGEEVVRWRCHHQSHRP